MLIQQNITIYEKMWKESFEALNSNRDDQTDLLIQKHGEIHNQADSEWINCCVGYPFI